MAQQAVHALDPMTAEEVALATSILREQRGVDDHWRFASMEAQEPAKEDLRSGGATPRTLRVVCFDRRYGTTVVAIVDVVRRQVVSFDEQPGRQANITVDEAAECDIALKKNTDVVAALRDRGITDLSTVYMDAWTYGGFLIPQQYRERRVAWTDTWLRPTPRSNMYARPVDGLHCIVDLNSMELLEIHNDIPADPPPETMGEYLPDMVPGLQSRTDIRPLQVIQPEGPSFEMNGHHLSWQKWDLRIGFNYREGLVLHQVGYRDGNVTRPIAHRLSIAEMVVPYRDPRTDHQARTAFDVGEWGLGFMTTSLALGCDCLGEIRYLDAVIHDAHGGPKTITNAICIHEEDDRVLWKHVDPHTGAETRRSRRLVISTHVTVANYEYLIYWSFYQDGSIEFEARATGMMVVSHLDHGQHTTHGTLVAERTYAPYHQHFLVARLDMEVDGPDCTVYADESFATPVGPDNPHGLGLEVRSTPLRRESQGRQDTDWKSQRRWRVASSHARNGHGDATSYVLTPEATFPSFFDASSPILGRAQVIGHSLWVTRYDAAERWPCGEFVNQSLDDEGLPQWIAQDRIIEDADVVLWHVFGIHHITRPEDWPVMPSDKVGFSLRPFGFFDRNPALDVPAEPGHGAACEHH